MDKKEIIDFINANLACNLATIEGNKPHVRGMMIYKADEKGILFHTWKMKDLHQQLIKNPYIELAFFNPKQMVQVRVSGEAELIEDMDLKKQVVNTPGREYLKQWIEEKKLFGYDGLSVFRVKNCKATVWTMSTNFEEKKYITL